MLRVGWQQGLVGGVDRLSEFAEGSGEMLDGVTHLVFRTRTCDLIKPPEHFAYVETLGCRFLDADSIAAIGRSEQNRFVVDREAGLVAFRDCPVTLRKTDAFPELRTHASNPFAGSPARASEFRRWLADAYNRPEFPDVVNRDLVAPLGKALDRVAKRGDERQFLFGRVQMVLAVGDIDASPQCRVQLIFVMRPYTRCERGAVALARLIREAKLVMAATAPPEKLAAAAVVVDAYRAVTASHVHLGFLQRPDVHELGLDG